MLSYAVVDRDRERLVEDLDIARQVGPTTNHRRKGERSGWLRRSASTRGTTQA